MVRTWNASFLTIVMAAILLVQSDRLFSADPPTIKAKRDFFTGEWVGTYYVKDVKKKGSYKFHPETNDRKVTADVSWEKEKMTLTGKRLGEDAIHLKGEHKHSTSGKITTYWYMGNMKKGKLVFQWLAVEKDTQKTSMGVSTLSR